MIDTAVHEPVSWTCAMRYAYNVVCGLGYNSVKYCVVCVRYRAPKISLPRCPTAGRSYEPIGLVKKVVRIKDRHPVPAQLPSRIR